VYSSRLEQEAKISQIIEKLPFDEQDDAIFKLITTNALNRSLNSAFFRLGEKNFLVDTGTEINYTTLPKALVKLLNLMINKKISPQFISMPTIEVARKLGDIIDQQPEEDEENLQNIEMMDIISQKVCQVECDKIKANKADDESYFATILKTFKRLSV